MAVSLWKRIRCLHYTVGKFENTTITDQFGFLFEKNSVRKNHIIVVTPSFSKKFRFQKVFRPRENETRHVFWRWPKNTRALGTRLQISPVLCGQSMRKLIHVYHALVLRAQSAGTNLSLYGDGSSFSRHFIESLAIFPSPHHSTEHSLYLASCLHLVLRHKQIHFSGRHAL